MFCLVMPQDSIAGMYEPMINDRTAALQRSISFISCSTPSPPTKSLGLGVFDSSRLLILRVGNVHVR